MRRLDERASLAFGNSAFAHLVFGRLVAILIPPVAMAFGGCDRSSSRAKPAAEGPSAQGPSAQGRLGAIPSTGQRAAKTAETAATQEAESSTAAPESCTPDAEIKALTASAPNPATAAAHLREKILSSKEARAYAEKPAEKAVRAIASESFSVLADLVDPADGLCLRPAKGAPCRSLSVGALRGCKNSNATEHWHVDDGTDLGPRYTCRQAFEQIFFTRDFLRPSKVRYNCFPEVGRGNNAATVITPPAARAYVEYSVQEQPAKTPSGFPAPWRSLWLVFDGDRDAPRLVELMAEYWGP